MPPEPTRFTISKSPARDREHAAAHRPRVVMLLANHFVHDTRVYKEACSLIGWGCEVHIIAMAGRDLPEYERNDGIHVHRVVRNTRLLWILPVALVFWWCRPVLRHLLSAREAGNQRQSARGVRALARWLWSMIRALLLRMRLLAGGIWKLFLYLFGSPALHAVQRRLKRLFPTSFRLLACNIQLARKALALKPDIVQSHDLNTLLAGAIVKRQIGIPLVYDSHELFLERNLGDRSRAWGKAVWAPIERFCIGNCDAVLSVSESICRHLARRYNIPKPHLIRNVQPYEEPPPNARTLSDELDIPKSTLHDWVSKGKPRARRVAGLRWGGKVVGTCVGPTNDKPCLPCAHRVPGADGTPETKHIYVVGVGRTPKGPNPHGPPEVSLYTSPRIRRALARNDLHLISHTFCGYGGGILRENFGENASPRNRTSDIRLNRPTLCH